MSSEDREERKAVRYAEDTLGVHSVYAAATAELDLLDDALDRLVAASREMRHFEERIEDAEIATIGDLKANDPKMSVAALERALKEERVNDETLRNLRRQHREAHDAYTQADADVSRHKYRLRAQTTRLNELGGLLNFYAATK